MPKRILIADDNSSIRDVLRSMLRDSPDIEICGEATDGVTTLEKGWELQPDLIVLDLAMPKMDGAVITSALKRRLPRTKIILFTMYGDDMAGRCFHLLTSMPCLRNRTVCSNWSTA